MKTAIDFYAPGKQKEADADEYDRSHYYSRERFICPECGEAVYLTGSKYSNFFSHYKKSDVSEECDRRVDGDPTDSVYERIGLPVYMRKTASSDFHLFMGFKALPISLMDKAVKEKVSIKIDKKNVYRINEERFSCEETSLIPLDYIPLSGTKYHISFEPPNKAYALSQHWSNYADGFSYEGALFSVSEQGGKKIRHGDSVSTDVDYYWVRRQTQLPSYIPGINMKECGRLILKETTMIVFYGTFCSDISDVEFSYLTSFLRNNLRIHLLEKKPEFIPLWPPSIKTEEGYVVDKSTMCVYGYVSSGNDIPKIYVYQGVQKIPNQLEAKHHLLSVQMWDQETLVNIDKKYVSSGTFFLKRNRPVLDNIIDPYMIYSDERINIQGKDIVHTCNTLLIESGCVTDFMKVRANGEIETLSGIGKHIFENLISKDYIYVITNKKLMSVISVLINMNEEQVTIRYDQLEQLMKKYRNSKYIKLPNKLRIDFTEILNKDKNNKTIKKILLDNILPKAIVKILEENLQ